MATVKQLFKNSLIELSKVNAPALKLYEFNYYINKAVYQYINGIYNAYDINQQTTDDIRILQTSVYLKPALVNKNTEAVVNDGAQKATNYLSEAHSSIASLYGAAYECWLPLDYLHLLNCICTFKVEKPYDCYDAGTYIQKPATRLTSDTWALIVDDIYNRPSHEKPYYMIYNQHRDSIYTTDDSMLPTDPVTAVTADDKKAGLKGVRGTDINGTYGVTQYDGEVAADGEQGSNFPRKFTFTNGTQTWEESLVERTAAQRIANPSNVRLEIRYGRDNSLFVLKEVQVDYIKAPQFLRLTQEQLDLTQDVTQILEWPDYVCQEITNILIRLLMERTADPRLGTNMQINQTIARPQAAAPAQQS